MRRKPKGGRQLPLFTHRTGTAFKTAPEPITGTLPEPEVLGILDMLEQEKAAAISQAASKMIGRG